MLPEQLAFEMHTKGARPCGKAVSRCTEGGYCCRTVPYMAKRIIADKGRRAVAELLYRLRGAGYQVAWMQLNRADKACADFLLVRTGPN